MNNKKLNRPPRIARRLLKYIFPDRGEYTSLGDFEEVYNQIAEGEGVIKARTWYWAELLRSLPGFIKNKIYWSLNMFKSYLKIALRNIIKHKGYSFINIIGLAIGMACCILVYMWIQDDLGYDRFHKHSKDLYRVVNDLKLGPFAAHVQGTAYPLGPAMKKEIPGIIDFTRFLSAKKMVVSYGEKKFYENNFFFTDPSVFKMFTFPFIKGDPDTALSSPSSVVITEDIAFKYFGKEDPIGKTLQMKNQHDYIVTGVIKNIPKNTYFRFDFLGSIERGVSLGTRTHWEGWFYETYVLLQPNISFKKVNKKLESWIKTKTDSREASYFLQPLTEVHFYGLNGDGAVSSLYLFSILAVLILMIACINYMNLSTARSAGRAKEIGIKKVVGANKKNIVKQFLVESLLFAFFGLVISIFLVEAFLPVFNDLSGKALNIDAALVKSILLGLIGITLVTGFLAGCYPALFLSSYKPAKILKGSLSTGSKSPKLRKILIVCQFTLSIVLIIGTIVVYNQLDYISNRKMGFKKEHLVFMQLRGKDALWKKYNVIKKEFLQDPGVKNVTASTCLPFGEVANEFGSLDWKGRNPEDNILMYHMAVDYSFLETFNIEMDKGRFFSGKIESDKSGFILNEAAVKVTGLDSPIGEKFRLLERTGQIIGVIKDFHFSSLRTEIKPLVLMTMPYSYWMYSNYIFVRIDARNIHGTLESLEKKWNKLVPGYPFVFNFSDAAIDNLYRSEQRLGKILRYFTFIALLISCLGLFGLVSFMAENRTREIGIRKVLGAPIIGIFVLFSKEFTKWVVLANIIAWPIAYYIMNKWLQNFAYHTTIRIDTFVISGLLAFLIAFLTISYQSIKAARANPVDALKYE